MTNTAERLRLSHAEKVSAGNCGWCNRPRNLYAWLCDSCATIHRDRQRERNRPWAEVRQNCQGWEVRLHPRIRRLGIVTVGPFRSEAEAEAVARLVRWEMREAANELEDGK